MRKLDELKEIILKFRDDRNWQQFHDPKNLSEAISIESSELLENFLWKTKYESTNLEGSDKKKIEEEVADIFIYILILCNELDIDLIQVVKEKVEINEKKYPVDKSKGKRIKYNNL